MHRHRFSLASLLLLTVVVAVYFAAIASARSDWGRIETDTEVVATLAIAGMVVGAVIGSIAGWRQIGKVRGVFIGGGTGIAAGIAGGVLMAMPGTFWTIAVGSTLLLLFAVAVRSSAPKQPKASGNRRSGRR